MKILLQSVTLEILLLLLFILIFLYILHYVVYKKKITLTEMNELHERI